MTGYGSVELRAVVSMFEPNRSLAQGPDVPTGDPGFDWAGEMMFFSPWVYLQHPSLLLHNPLSFLAAGLWVWMLIHCIRYDPERNLWLWILFIGNVPGALIYFCVRWLPGARVAGGASLFSRWTKARQIPRLEAAARNIGNAHQFVELGDALRETGKHDRAAESYASALKKDPALLPALWGAAQVELLRKNHSAAKPHLEAVLAKDISYKFGDVSLAYCRVLCSLNEPAAAETHLEQHLKRWTHPEAYVLVAELLIAKGDNGGARQRLEAVIMDLRAAPAFFARQNRGWGSRAKRLLKRLPQ